jgi:Cof subfamily protein (haloacid dehalogenase superfamily)
VRKDEGMRPVDDLELPEHPVDVRLVVADMDGTLLDDAGRVPESFWPMLDRMHEAGILFAPASGRQYATLAHLFDRAKEGMVFIAENGSYVVKDGVELSSTVLDRPFVDRLITHLRTLSSQGHDLGIVLCGKRSAYVERSDRAFLIEVEKYYLELATVEDLIAVDDEVIKVAILDFEDAEANIAPTLGAFRDSHQVVVSGEHWIDVMNAGVNKGVALRALQTRLGIEHDQTVAFGDYLNDREMLDAAGLSFAMANAHPEIISRARYSAPSYLDNGVVTVLEKLLEGI